MAGLNVTKPCAISSLLRSVQFLVEVVRAIGLNAAATLVVTASLYRLIDHLTAVFESPNTSYTSCRRGAQSCQSGMSLRSTVVRSGTKRPAPEVVTSTCELNFSQRMP